MRKNRSGLLITISLALAACVYVPASAQEAEAGALVIAVPGSDVTLSVTKDGIAMSAGGNSVTVSSDGVTIHSVTPIAIDTPNVLIDRKGNITLKAPNNLVLEGNDLTVRGSSLYFAAVERVLVESERRISLRAKDNITTDARELDLDASRVRLAGGMRRVAYEGAPVYVSPMSGFGSIRGGSHRVWVP